MGLVIFCVEMLNFEGVLLLGLFVKGYVIIGCENVLLIFQCVIICQFDGLLFVYVVNKNNEVEG